MANHKVSAEAWALLRGSAASRGATLEGENSQRNEDGTYTVELTDDFEAKLRLLMLPGETVEGYILRCLKKLQN